MTRPDFEPKPISKINILPQEKVDAILNLVADKDRRRRSAEFNKFLKEKLPPGARRPIVMGEV